MGAGSLSWNDKEKLKKMIKKIGMNKQFLNSHLSVSKKGNLVAITQKDGSVILWDTTKNKLTPFIQGNVHSTSLSPSGRYIGIINKKRNSEKSFLILDVNSNKMVASMPAKAGETGFIGFTNAEEKVFVGISNFVLGYDLNSGKNIIKGSMPVTIRHSSTQTCEPVLSDNDQYLTCMLPASMHTLLISLSDGNLKGLRAAEMFSFLNNNLVLVNMYGQFFIKSDNIEKLMNVSSNDIEYGKSELMEKLNFNIPQQIGMVKKKGKSYVIGDNYYFNYMDEELGQTVVYAVKIAMQ